MNSARLVLFATTAQTRIRISTQPLTSGISLPRVLPKRLYNSDMDSPATNKRGRENEEMLQASLLDGTLPGETSAAHESKLQSELASRNAQRDHVKRLRQNSSMHPGLGYSPAQENAPSIFESPYRPLPFYPPPGTPESHVDPARETRLTLPRRIPKSDRQTHADVLTNQDFRFERNRCCPGELQQAPRNKPHEGHKIKHDDDQSAKTPDDHTPSSQAPGSPRYQLHKGNFEHLNTSVRTSDTNPKNPFPFAPDLPKATPGRLLEDLFRSSVINQGEEHNDQGVPSGPSQHGGRHSTHSIRPSALTEIRNFPPIQTEPGKPIVDDAVAKVRRS
jgi:hypothetical protein